MQHPENLDDGLIAPEVGPWSIDDKCALMSMYLSIFTKAMRDKWSRLAYIDLFSGAGKSTVRDDGVVVRGSPLRALTQETPFDRLVFCESDAERHDALVKRVDDLGGSERVRVIKGDANQCVNQIVAAVLDGGVKPNEVLALCFVDPYNAKSLKFDTLRVIGGCLPHVDFMILIPTGMDIRRNPHYYVPASSSLISDFTGAPDWREEWEREEAKAEADFGGFVVNLFAKSMQQMGFIYDPVKSLMRVRSNRNAHLYDLAFFSRHPLGLKFFTNSIRYSPRQRSLKGI